jgi:predicted aldo/keto reductase-like oxidoreductase
METASSTMPLSSTEREDFRERFEKRLEKVKAKTADVFAFKELSGVATLASQRVCGPSPCRSRGPGHNG